ncbi:nucleotidyltransferase family protein [Roseovarius sp. SYSU LYC5161]|uniref:nucleotidyltransferase family protein n=1 Tax=Roseovarius halophilus (ex Wu et al. 2025) TaxID=3376060 RepID=UPI003999A33C
MPDHPGAVMLFAAGFGTRMGALTRDRPKPMVEVAGRPLIDHALDHVTAFGAARIVANTHYKPEPLREHLAGRGVALSHETPDILETGGGLRAALPLLGPGPVFTMNTDAVWSGPNPLAHLAAAWRPDEMDALLLCVRRDNALGHAGDGDFSIDVDGRATRGPGAVYTGLQIIRPDRLHDVPGSSFSLNLLWDRILETGRFHATLYPGKWCDVGRPASIALAESMLGCGDV